MIKNKKGFTLIEILVVILIIGILAAIALPKYQLVRDQAEFRKYQSMVSSLRDAYNEYILIYGKGTKNFSDLSLILPSDFQSSGVSSMFDCLSNTDMFCCLSNSSSGRSAVIMCGKNDLSFVYSESFLGSDNNYEIRHVGICKAAEDNNRAHRLCNSLGIKGKRANAFTPQGVISGYTNYAVN